MSHEWDRKDVAADRAEWVHYCAALLPVYSAVFTKYMLTNICLTLPER